MQGIAAERAVRLERVRTAMQAEELGAFLVFGLDNVRYLTGFSGSAGVVLVTPGEVVLISDSRYRLAAAVEAPEARFFETNEPLATHLPGLLGGVAGVVGIERTHLYLEQWERLAKGLGAIEHRLVGGIVEKLRMVKSAGEVRAIREAGALAVASLDYLAASRVVGRTERDVALDLETWVRREGSGPVPFTFIVAAGPRGAMPHAEASAQPIPAGTLLVVDLGASVDGYASDLTRTFATGPAATLDGEALAIYDLTRRAQEAARHVARADMPCRDVDAVARGLITAEGYGELFKHGLGHGVGLDVHEEPRVSERSEDVLAEGMVVTIEPGIYIEGKVGVRIEDSVLVTATGIDVLTPFTYDLVELG
jgi:Xaa-Pro aminopeptidase